MRLSEFLRKDVVDMHGTSAGHVHDVRLVQDGAVGAGFDAALRVQGLIVGRGGVGNRLGYGHSTMAGPWLLRTIFEARRQARFVPWARIREIRPDAIVIDGSVDDLEAAAIPPVRGAST